MIFTSVLLTDARGVVERSAFPFFLEGTRFDQPDPLFQEWLKHLRAKRTDLMTLYGIEVFTPEQMVQKYGKPPARLALPLQGPGKTYVAVANLSGRAAIAVMREEGNRWRMVGYHD
jgi:hypothetical protein